MAVIEQGVLKTFLHNTKTALKDGVDSTGHAYKASYKGTLSIAPSNFYIENGPQTYDELIESMEEGIMITSVQGLHSGTNVVSGDFSLAAHGYYVKHGKIEKPVNQITIAGNFYELLNNIEAIGDDLQFGRPSGGYVGSPTLKIKSLAVAGK
jgi:PmbA protein